MKPVFIKLSTVFFLLILVYIACDKKALNVAPPTPTEESYFSSETEFRTAVVGVYASIIDYYSSANIPGGGGVAESEAFLLPGDDLTVNAAEPYEIFSGINPDEGKLGDIFGSSYILIGRANTVLQKLRSVKDGIFTTPNLKNYNIGEMLFLRAFAHFTLWNLFGTAPVDTIRLVSTSQLNPPSSKGTELLDQAISDLQQAATLLPTTPWDATDVGRATVNSAYGLLGKCLVFRATVNKSPVDYSAAIDAFNKINGVDLVSNFEDNFDVNKENNQESLFEFQAGVPIAGAGTTNYWLANDAVNIGVASAYYASFGAPSGNQYVGGGTYVATNKLMTIFDPADPRLPLTLTTGSGYINKYILNNKTEGCCGITSVNNTRILRYADVLLLQAEAVLQSGGNTSTAIGLINRVRARARNMVAGGTVPADLDASVTDKTTIMQWVMDERLRELAAEGHRWYDLRRWALAGMVTLNNSFFSSVATNLSFDAHYLNFPIPSSETSKNPNITQNTGY